jgi:hypothetical protein
VQGSAIAAVDSSAASATKSVWLAKANGSEWDRGPKFDGSGGGCLDQQ